MFVWFKIVCDDFVLVLVDVVEVFVVVVVEVMFESKLCDVVMLKVVVDVNVVFKGYVLIDLNVLCVMIVEVLDEIWDVKG